MNEFDLINKIKQTYYRQSSLIKGIGDDAAVFKQANASVVTAVDTFVEDVHFIKNKTLSTKEIGYRCLAANISDLAAMGALPKFYLVSVVIPDDWNEREVLDVFEGLSELAQKNKMDLIGGDTISGKQFVLSVTVVGYADEGKIRYRSLAQKDDIVFVTGTLGDSSLGLALLLEELDLDNRAYFINRHKLPQPRIAFSQAIKTVDRVCLNDISDGLSSELNEIAKASKVSMMVHDKRIPVNQALKNLPEESMKKYMYSGGEDFELVGTTSEDNWLKIKEIAKKEKIKVTEIGKVLASDNDKVYLDNYNQILKSSGYIHLK